MKPFYTTMPDSAPMSVGTQGSSPSCPALDPAVPVRALIAVYDASGIAPRIEEVLPALVPDYIEALATRVYELAREQGSSIPYTVVREVSENFIHAKFAEPVVSILDSGRTIRFADQGPGISDKDRAVLPGFTTARGEMKRYIRGVGSGLPIVSDYLSFSGGSLVIEDNLGSGSVVTIKTCGVRDLSMPQGKQQDAYFVGSSDSTRQTHQQQLLHTTGPGLTARQKHVLALVLESGTAGPSLVAKELRVGISTAYRDLALLEEIGLISSDGGKRTLTAQGLSYIDELTSR